MAPDSDAADVWPTLRERVGALPPEALVRTPSGRELAVRWTDDRRIVVRFRDTGEAQVLDRDQLEALAERAADEELATDELPDGVEAYAAVLTLYPRFALADGRLRRTDEREPESSLLVERERRADPEAVHDDALLLVDEVERRGVDRLPDLPTDVLVDLYVLLSDVQYGATDFRRDVGDVLLERVGDEPVHGQYGSVRRTTRETRTLKDDETVVERFEAVGIPRERLLGVVPDRVDVALAVTNVPEEDVYDVDEQTYVQKTEVEDEAKATRLSGLRERLSGLRERLSGLRSEEAERIESEIADLEERIEELVAREA